MSRSSYEIRGEYVGCPICRGEDQEYCQRMPVAGDSAGFDCFVCGKFRVSGTVLADFERGSSLDFSPSERACLSHRIRLENDARDFSPGDAPMITSETIERIKNSTSELPLVTEQLRNLIRAVGRATIEEDGKPFPNGRHRSRAGCLNTGQLSRLFEIGTGSGVFSKKTGKSYKNTRGHTVLGEEYELTLEGWKQYEESLKGLKPGHYGFMAMQYGVDELEDFVQRVVKPATKEGVGYELVDLRDVSQAGIIDNLLRQQIRDAAFVIVDLTHDNSGAYWEAGYAEGLGKPVIYICEKRSLTKARRISILIIVPR